jgi:hypothetical protein
MTISMYQASAPRLANMLRNLDAILARAQAHATAKKIDPAVLLGARLFPDMLPLVKQVQIATDHAKGCVARLAGVEVPKFEDTRAELRGSAGAHRQDHRLRRIVFRGTDRRFRGA